MAHEFLDLSFLLPSIGFVGVIKPLPGLDLQSAAEEVRLSTVQNNVEVGCLRTVPTESFRHAVDSKHCSSWLHRLHED